MYEDNRVQSLGKLNSPVAMGVGNPKQSELDIVLGKLASSVECINLTLENFAARLAPVLRPESPNASKEAIEAEFSTLVAQKVNSEVRKIYQLNEAVNSILSRLEL